MAKEIGSPAARSRERRTLTLALADTIRPRSNEAESFHRAQMSAGSVF
jgi:hypothetical protein